MSALWLLGACYVGTVCFALIFGAPPRSLPLCGLIGALGYGAFLLVQKGGVGTSVSVFVAAAVVGITSELFARASKLPATVYITAGILPLVPGASAYLSMLLFSQGNYREALVAGSNVLHIAVAISAGLAISTALRKKQNHA